MNKIITTLIMAYFTLPMLGQEVGLQLYSLRNELPKDVRGTLAKIKSWGITYLEDGNDGTYGYSQKEYNAMLEENDLKIVSVSASFEALRDNPEAVLKRAENYGAKYAVCFWIPHKGNHFTILDIDNALEVFNKAGSYLSENGVTLAYHPHGYEFRPYRKGLLIDRLIQNSNEFVFEMDVYWFAHAGEDPVNWLRKYPEEFRLIHLKDCKKGTKGNQNGTSDVETNVILGSGQIDIEAVIAEARKLNVDYMFIEDESSRAVHQILPSLMFLKGLEKR